MNRIFSLVFLVICIGCSDDDDSRVRGNIGPTSPIINTGYHAYDMNGSLIFDVGTPNTLRDTVIHQAEASIRTFPNPAWPSDGFSGTVIWNITVQKPTPDSEIKATLAKANYAEEFLSPEWFQNGGFDQILIDSMVVWEGEFEQPFIQIDVTEFGDYRLYVEMDSIVLYDNLAVREFLTY